MSRTHWSCGAQAAVFRDTLYTSHEFPTRMPSHMPPGSQSAFGSHTHANEDGHGASQQLLPPRPYQPCFPCGYWWRRCKVGLVAKTAGLLAHGIEGSAKLLTAGCARHLCMCSSHPARVRATRGSAKGWAAAATAVWDAPSPPA
eukprot:scaffold34349_cov57-Phaeocystis_antarctica.AAC.1